MANEEYFLPIKVPEKEDYETYLFLKRLYETDTYFQKFLIKIFDEIELYTLSNGKFYKNESDFQNGKELGYDEIFYPDKVDQQLKTVEIIKELTWDSRIKNIYEIRMDSDLHVHRILIFPFSMENNIVDVPFVTLAYWFDKREVENGNLLTDELRDSTYRIRNDFKNEDEIGKYLIIS